MTSIGQISEMPRLDVWVGPIDPRFANLALTVGAATGYAAAFRVDRPITVSKAGIGVAATGGSLTLGIYSAAGALLASTALTAVAGGVTYQEVALTAPLQLVPGRVYWAALGTELNTPTFYGLASPTVGLVGLIATFAAAGGVLPATASLATTIARNFGIRFVV